MEHRPALRQDLTVIASGITWMAVHGNLCLALRHPKNTGPSRQLIDDFLLQLGGYLVDAGVLTAEELAEAEGLEATERRRQLKCEECGCTEDRACEGGCGWDAIELARGRRICTRCTGRMRRA
jgi:hypothetical protein